ncbi:hypothetical protein DVH24_034743 [Malus domestica]|uniref:ADP-ribosyl cyclase/cyclic ADP-ribose hydrolase n=1 Tax=Malus domestica TaxID=3750 RepID=A0A498J1Y7_MALDO|nr:hypothetical protein DVH24_034743 [Malus domestica]
MALVLGAQQAAPSSNTYCSSGCSYDVFLSFRGEDTRVNFADHLYTALDNASFRTFRDENDLERGESIKPELEKAIQQSLSSVVVFSKNYASSKWCLNELVMILKLKKTSDHVVLPVFYDVDPSHVRNQTGSLAKAFARHQKTQSCDTVKEWREALTEVAGLAGMVLQNEADGYVQPAIFPMRIFLGILVISLQILDLSSNSICSLPDCVRGVRRLRKLSFEGCKRLKSLLRLPSVGELEILDCKSLEMITNLNLNETIMMKIISPFSRERSMTHSLQGLYEYGIFSTFLLGDYEVPQYGSFSRKSIGPPISFTVPSLPTSRIRGLNFFYVYAKSNNDDSPEINADNDLPHPVIMKVSNKSKVLKWIYGPTFLCVPGDGQDVIWLSHWKFGNKLEVGDDLTFSVFAWHKDSMNMAYSVYFFLEITRILNMAGLP